MYEDQVLASLEKELAPIERNVQEWLSTNVADLIARAATLGLGFVIR